MVADSKKLCQFKFKLISICFSVLNTPETERSRLKSHKQIDYQFMSFIQISVTLFCWDTQVRKTGEICLQVQNPFRI